MSDDPKSFKKTRGRPTKITPELEDRIVTLIKAGNYIEVAAAAVGVPRETLHRWLRHGNDRPGSVYGRFRHSVESAVAYSQARDVLVIDKAAQAGNWKAAAWRLERKNSSLWGRRDSLAVEHGGQVQALVVEERRKALIAVVADPAKRALLTEMVRALRPARDQADGNVIDAEAREVSGG